MSIAIQDGINLEELRARLRKMTDTELRHFGKAAKFMCSPEANLGKPRQELTPLSKPFKTKGHWNFQTAAHPY